MSIVMTDGKRVQVIGEHETVRRRLLEEQGWHEGEPEPQGEPGPDPRDLEERLLDGAEALAPEAVKAAKEARKKRKTTESKLPTL